MSKSYRFVKHYAIKKERLHEGRPLGGGERRGLGRRRHDGLGAALLGNHVVWVEDFHVPRGRGLRHGRLVSLRGLLGRGSGLDRGCLGRNDDELARERGRGRLFAELELLCHDDEPGQEVLGVEVPEVLIRGPEELDQQELEVRDPHVLFRRDRGQVHDPLKVGVGSEDTPAYRFDEPVGRVRLRTRREVAHEEYPQERNGLGALGLDSRRVQVLGAGDPARVVQKPLPEEILQEARGDGLHELVHAEQSEQLLGL